MDQLSAELNSGTIILRMNLMIYVILRFVYVGINCYFIWNRENTTDTFQNNVHFLLEIGLI